MTALQGETIYEEIIAINHSPAAYRGRLRGCDHRHWNFDPVLPHEHILQLLPLRHALHRCRDRRHGLDHLAAMVLWHGKHHDERPGCHLHEALRCHSAGNRHLGKLLRRRRSSI